MLTFHPLLVILSVVLAILVLINGPKKIPNISFSIFSLLSGFWVACLFIIFLPIFPPSLSMAKLVFLGPILMPIVLLIFSLSYPIPRPISWWKWPFLFFIPALLLVSLPSSFIVVDFLDNKTLVRGPGHIIFIAYFLSYFTLSAVILYRHLRRLKGVDQLKVRYFFFALSLSAVPAVITNLLLPAWGVYSYNHLGPYFTLFFFTINTYAIVKHRLMDIVVVISRSLAIFFSLGFYLILYYVVIFVLQAFSLSSSDPSFVFTTIIFWGSACLSFNAVRLKIQTTADQTLLKGRLDPQLVLEKFSTQLTEALSLAEVIDAFHHIGDTILELSSVYFYHLDQNRYTLVSPSIPVDYTNAAAMPASIPALSLLPTWANTHQTVSYIKEIESHDVKSFLETRNIVIISAIRSQKKNIGLFFLGDKLSEDAFTIEDFKLLKTISSQLALALERIRPYEEVKQAYTKSVATAEKMAQQASFATLTRGIAHEIRNPMGIILSGMELIQDNIDDKKNVLAYTEMVKQSILRLSNITNTMLKYGKPVAGELTRFSVNTLIMDLIGISMPKSQSLGIKLQLRLTDVPDIHGDPNSIGQVIQNIFLNAMQSLPEQKGIIRFHTRRSSFVDTQGKQHDSVAFRIADNGSGIEKQDLKKIYDPFFSTKYENAGLGLSIVLKTMSAHNGFIDIQSKPGKGTMVTCHLPLD